MDKEKLLQHLRTIIHQCDDWSNDTVSTNRPVDLLLRADALVAVIRTEAEQAEQALGPQH